MITGKARSAQTKCAFCGERAQRVMNTITADDGSRKEVCDNCHRRVLRTHTRTRTHQERIPELLRAATKEQLQQLQLQLKQQLLLY